MVDRIQFKDAIGEPCDIGFYPASGTGTAMLAFGADFFQGAIWVDRELAEKLIPILAYFRDNGELRQ